MPLPDTAPGVMPPIRTWMPADDPLDRVVAERAGIAA